MSEHVFVQQIMQGFNPRAREGRDRARSVQTKSVCVSIHAPVKGAMPVKKRLFVLCVGFNPRAREGRDPRFIAPGILFCRFNPRAREGRDRQSMVGECYAEKVSIHAPVKGAMAGRFIVQLFQCVSIHAPVKGAIGRRRTVQTVLLRFNPRAREGRDACSSDGSGSSQRVSIHAPVKGAITPTNGMRSTLTVSIHAPVKGAMLPELEKLSKSSCFNPRAREGRDL